MLCPKSFQVKYNHITDLQVTGELFYSDAIGNIYVVTGNRIQKFNKNHQKQAEYSNSFLGNISHADVTDPLRIMLYYKDYNQILWLDNYLSELRSPVHLDALNLDQVELVCSSSQGGFWVYNSLNSQLQYFNWNLNLVHESITLNILVAADQKPSFMVEKNRYLYLSIPSSGIFVFDRFGNYSKTIPVTNTKKFQVTDESIFTFYKSTFLRINLKNYQTTQIALPDTTNLVDVEIQPDYLYLYKPNKVSIYRKRD